MKPATPNDRQRHEYLRSLWGREGSLARACWRYATMTGDTVFAVQEMVRGQLGRPVPGLWRQIPLEAAEHPGLQETVAAALQGQREELRRAQVRRFTMLALLQQAALRDLSLAQTKGPGGYRETVLAEARCRDLTLMARLLVEQDAMREAALQLGDDHPADLTACRLLYWAAEEALEAFDRKLESGQVLAEALAVEILLESVPSSVER
ncbi:MAG TPA: hypothetical protein VNH46_05985 [Gemmatimonadales bacterium]|nr:hypothetical protein [Gemmatimonadales bacterium]